MASGGSKSLRGEEIRNILVEYEGQISSDSEIDGEFDTSDNGSSHVDDIALGEATVSEIDIEAEERTEGFCWENMDNYVKQREAFYDVSEPQNNAKDVSDIVGCFELFFSSDLVHHIVEETNRYVQQYQNSRGNLFSFQSPVRSWYPVTNNEIYVVLGFYMLTGIIQKPTTRLYFSKRRIVQTPGFGDIITRGRLELICRFLHFNDRVNRSTQAHLNYSRFTPSCLT
jgi:hypothetical protein